MDELTGHKNNIDRIVNNEEYPHHQKMELLMKFICHQLLDIEQLLKSKPPTSS